MNGITAAGNPSSTFTGGANQFTMKSDGEKQERGVSDMIASPSPRNTIQSPLMYDKSGKTDPVSSNRLFNGRYNRVF